MKTRYIICAVAVACVGFAQIVPPLPVYDLANHIANSTNTLKLIAQIENEIAQIKILTDQITHMRTMAKQIPVSMKQRYFTLGPTWVPVGITDVLRAHPDWSTAVNTGTRTPIAYGQVTVPLSIYGSVLPASPGQLARVRNVISGVELSDATNIHTIDVIGAVRRNADATGTVIANMKADAFDSTDSFHTEIAELNKLNAAHTVSLQQTHDQTQILASLAEQGLVNAKAQRDTTARAVEQDIAFRQAVAAGKLQTDDMSAAMMSFKF
ncbi:MAG: hypothetical protein M3Z85_07125 [Acidobacteriota bacterium]|nr:hypothetical protein [Acidobacteriota bacterium]